MGRGCFWLAVSAMVSWLHFRNIMGEGCGGESWEARGTVMGSPVPGSGFQAPPRREASRAWGGLREPVRGGNERGPWGGTSVPHRTLDFILGLFGRLNQKFLENGVKVMVHGAQCP